LWLGAVSKILTLPSLFTTFPPAAEAGRWALKINQGEQYG